MASAARKNSQGMLAACSRRSRVQDAPQHEQPDEEAYGEQDLPDAREVEVLEALQPEPVRGSVAERAVNAQEGADQRSKTTTASAPSSMKASLPWPRGSRRAIIGARKIPAATNRWRPRRSPAARARSASG